MADRKELENDEPLSTDATGERIDEVTGEGEEAARPKLNLDVRIDTRSACERHVTIVVPREDIELYFDREFSELMPSAQVPGFRPGRAPRKLVENRFRKQVADRVKANLLMDALSQVDEEKSITPISEPNLDLEAVELPEEGPLTFEYDIEVRPDFDLPHWKGLEIEKPVREVTAGDIDEALERLLATRGRLVPYEGPARAGDYLSLNLTFRHDGNVLSGAREEVIRIRPVLSFRDGKIENFEQLMVGVVAGDTRTATTQISADAPNEALRGATVDAEFHVLEVKRLELPEFTPELLEELGGFKLEADLRDAVKDSLERRLAYEQRRRARDQIAAALTESAKWELPPELLRRQSRRELERAIMELQRSGFSQDEIRAHENELRQNSLVSTAKALKEHFILERIAEDQQIEAADDDYDHEIFLIAQQSGQSPRRVRARLEKGGSMDVLRNQIIERKVIDLILEQARFKEVPFEFQAIEAEAVDQNLGGGQDADIPEAKPGGEEEPRTRPGETRPRT